MIVNPTLTTRRSIHSPKVKLGTTIGMPSSGFQINLYAVNGSFLMMSRMGLQMTRCRNLGDDAEAAGSRGRGCTVVLAAGSAASNTEKSGV